LTILYELQADNYGVKYLRDIRVKVDGEELTHPMVSFEVLKEPQVKPDVFVMADIPKTDLFVGEGVVVRYYLYSKVSVSNLDIKKYPKLNRFLKRYLQEPDRAERVEVDGDLYIRNLIYAAKLFPEKAGTLKIDPISLSVTYSRSNRNDPFNVFASPRNMRTRTISSEVINLNVLPWPTPVPQNFTGLVGKHDFSLNMNQTKLVVNQPLEITLTVSGPGALENFEAPKVLENNALEEFESHGELRIQDTDMATKVFTYTFLASAPLDLAAKKLSYSYLDPVSAKYVEVDLVRDALQVGGQARAEPAKKTKNNTSSVQDTPQKTDEPNELKKISTDVSWSRWQNYINAVLGVMALALLLSFSGLRLKKSISQRAIVPSHFKKSFNNHEFIKWMSPAIAKEAKSPKEVLIDLELSAEAQKYFMDLMNSSDASKFSIGKKDYKYTYKEKHFKELASKIEKYHESYS
ncbi:MAG: hypothetical protein WDA09_10530, partial [Bacteriovoracaceae bacterium]